MIVSERENHSFAGDDGTSASHTRTMYLVNIHYTSPNQNQTNRQRM